MTIKPVPKCAVINDMSGYGRCSITVAMPILSVMGVQACPLPTAILSNHTAYEDFFFEDFTENMRTYFQKWEKLNLEFDSIYTGFLGSEQQIELILEFVKEFKRPETLLFVDPVMGDHGKMYATYNSSLCKEMKKLVALADVITPNLTEACILTDTDYPTEPKDEDVFRIGEKLMALGAKTVIITGVRRQGKMVNFLLKDGQRQALESEFVACEYCGTGDVFASLMCGYLTQGEDCISALEKSAKFLIKTIEYSHKTNVSPRDGVAFERYLKEIE